MAERNPKDFSDKGEPGKEKPGEGEPGKEKPGEGEPGKEKPGEGEPGRGELQQNQDSEHLQEDNPQSNLDDEERVELRAYGYSGPLPHPSLLAGYDQIIPSGAERIMIMAEKEQDHRHKRDTKGDKRTFILRTTGQYFALIISISIIWGAIWLGLEGHDWLAGTLVAIDLIALAALFILGKSPIVVEKKSEDDEEEGDDE